MTQIIPYSFNEVQETLKQEAIDSGLVSDTEYEGSNISQLIRVMAYAVQSANMNTTYGVNEMLLTQSTEYNNVLKLARQLGYVPKRRVSYTYNVKLQPPQAGLYKIPKYTKFESRDNTYYYLGKEIFRDFQYYIIAYFGTPVNNTDGSNTAPTNIDIPVGSIIVLSNNRKAVVLNIKNSPDNDENKKYIQLDFSGNIFTDDVHSDFSVTDASSNVICNGNLRDIADTRIEEIQIKEGVLHQYYDEVSNPDGEKDLYVVFDKLEDNEPKNYIDLDYYNIEENGIELYCTYFAEDGLLHVKEPWEKRDYFIVDKDIFQEQRTYLPLMNIDLGTLRIYFKIAETGFTPKLYSKFYINLLESKGALGKAQEPFKIDLDDFVIVNDLEIANIGTDIEVVESIRENAMSFHNTGNRAVTRKDYISICNRDNRIKSTQCWGGEEDLPIKHLGHVNFSFLPSTRPLDFIGDSTRSIFKLNRTSRNDKEFNLKEQDIRNPNIQSYNANYGIFDTLDSYKIITLVLNSTANMFIDINLLVDIRKYYITQSTAEINENLTKRIVEYFHDVVETYDYDFFKSNITRIIDEELGLMTGLKLDISTSIPLYTEQLQEVQECTNVYNIDIWFGYPFDGILDEYNYFNNEMMPIIDTDNFLRDNNNNELYIGRYRIAGTFIGGTGIRMDEEIMELDIFYGKNKDQMKNYNNKDERFINNTDVTVPETDDKVGKVYINTKEKTILIRLFVKDTNTSEYNISPCVDVNYIQSYLDTIISTNHFLITDPNTQINRDELRIDLKYPFDDINFVKNSIGRLTSIKFI